MEYVMEENVIETDVILASKEPLGIRLKQDDEEKERYYSNEGVVENKGGDQHDEENESIYEYAEEGSIVRTVVVSAFLPRSSYECDDSQHDLLNSNSLLSDDICQAEATGRIFVGDILCRVCGLSVIGWDMDDVVEEIADARNRSASITLTFRRSLMRQSSSSQWSDFVID